MKGCSGGESYQQQVTWMEQKARNCGKAPTTRRRCSSRRSPRRKALLDNVGCSACEAMVCKDDDLLLATTGYSTDAFERDEEQFMNDQEKSRVLRKSVNKVKPMAQEGSSGGARGGPFAFQKRVERIDWRSVHSVDVDRLIREVGNVTQPVLTVMMFMEKKELNL